MQAIKHKLIRTKWQETYTMCMQTNKKSDGRAHTLTRLCSQTLPNEMNS